MIPYIVKCSISVSPYMNDPYEIDDIRIVMAADEQEAREKYEKYWSDQTSEYSIYYNAFGCTVMETIV